MKTGGATKIAIRFHCQASARIVGLEDRAQSSRSAVEDALEGGEMVVDLAAGLGRPITRIRKDEDPLVTAVFAGTAVEGVDPFVRGKSLEIEVRVSPERDSRGRLGMQIVMFGGELESIASPHERPVHVALAVGA